jgi:hypothetical protein
MGWVERFGEKNNFSRSPFSPSKYLQTPQTTHPKTASSTALFFYSHIIQSTKIQHTNAFRISQY